MHNSKNGNEWGSLQTVGGFSIALAVLAARTVISMGGRGRGVSWHERRRQSVWSDLGACLTVALSQEVRESLVGTCIVIEICSNGTCYYEVASTLTERRGLLISWSPLSIAEMDRNISIIDMVGVIQYLTFLVFLHIIRQSLWSNRIIMYIVYKNCHFSSYNIHNYR